MSDPKNGTQPSEEEDQVSLAALRRKEADSDDEELSQTEVRYLLVARISILDIQANWCEKFHARVSSCDLGFLEIDAQSRCCLSNVPV